MTVQAASNEASQALLDSVNGAKSKKSSTADAQDRFMTLLVTQMKNQDPLNPMDNAQVTSQMAQLSTVSGIDKLNATLENMMQSTQASQSLQASNLIGRSVLVDDSSIKFDGTAGNFGVNLASGVDSMKVTITDGAGVPVRQLNYGKQAAGIVPLSWDGMTDAGTKAANGDYKFTVSAVSGGQAAEANTLSLVVVNSITSGANGVKLNLSNASSVTTAEVKQIY